MKTSETRKILKEIVESERTRQKYMIAYKYFVQPVLNMYYSTGLFYDAESTALLEAIHFRLIQETVL